MEIPTWGQLLDNFCSVRETNPHYEEFATRRYNFAACDDTQRCRLVFLKGVLQEPENKTLVRKGRFIWCKHLKYEGVGLDGLRRISFTVDSGRKRFCISENNILCIPSKLCVANNRYFRSRSKTFLPFSSVFSYEKTLRMMSKYSPHDEKLFADIVQGESPYKPGTLVSPRLGYFSPEVDPEKILNKEILRHKAHPCGLILGRSRSDNTYIKKEFYRVRFGDTTYERVHPTQMEILNEV